MTGAQKWESLISIELKFELCEIQLARFTDTQFDRIRIDVVDEQVSRNFRVERTFSAAIRPSENSDPRCAQACN